MLVRGVSVMIVVLSRGTVVMAAVCVGSAGVQGDDRQKGGEQEAEQALHRFRMIFWIMTARPRMRMRLSSSPW